MKNTVLMLDPLGHSSQIIKLIVTKDKDIITASVDKTIRIWDSKTLKEKRRILGQIGSGSEGKIYSMALSPDEKYLAVGGFMGSYTGAKDRLDEEAHKIRIYDYKSGKLRHLLKGHVSNVNSISFSQDGEYMISAGAGYFTHIWAVNEDFKLNQSLRYNPTSSHAVDLLKKDEKYYALTTNIRGELIIYDLEKKKIHKYVNTKIRIQDLAVNFKLEHIVVTGRNTLFRVYDFDLNEVDSINQKNVPTGLAYSKDGSQLIVGSASVPMEINVYKAGSSYVKKATFKEHKDLTMAVGFLDENTAVSAGGLHYELDVWNINNPSAFIQTKGSGETRFMVALKDNIISWESVYKDKAHTNQSNVLPYHFDLKTFTLLKDENQSFMHISSKNDTYSLAHERGGNYKYPNAVLTISKDSKVLASIIKDRTNGYRHLCYGWYKDYIISSSTNGKIFVYNKEGKQLAILRGHTESVYSIAFENDRLVSVSDDQQIKVWDLKDLEDKKVILPTLSLFIGRDKQWVAWNEEGYYTASKEGAKFLKYHVNQGADKEARSYEAVKVKEQFYKPEFMKRLVN